MKLNVAISAILLSIYNHTAVAAQSNKLRGAISNGDPPSVDSPKRALNNKARPGESCRNHSDCESSYCTGESLEQDGICVNQFELESKKIDPSVWESRINEIHWAGCHNCYQPENAEEFSTYREVVHGIPALELDVRECSGVWKVGHGSCNDNERFYEKLEDYFEDIRRTLVDDQFQLPIIVNLDFKNFFLSGKNSHGERMNVLISDKFGDRVFTKNDLAAYNDLSTDTDFSNPAWSQFRSKAAGNADFWPKAIENVIRNKVIFVANHISNCEVSDIREYNTLFLGPSFDFDYQVSGDIPCVRDDGQVVFANLRQDGRKCEGDLPQKLSDARMISRCWDGSNPDSFFIEKQWLNDVAIGTSHNVQAEPLKYKARTSPDSSFCQRVDSCNLGSFQGKRWTCLDNHNIAAGAGNSCPTSWVECEVGANPGILDGQHWVCGTDRELQVGDSCDVEWVTFDEWEARCDL